MRRKTFIYLLGIFVLLFASIQNASSKTLVNGVEIALTLTDDPFKYPTDPSKGHRSIPIDVPISAFLNDNSIELDFFQPVGEIEIIISQDGTIVYSSSENVESSMVKSIQLPQNASGNFMIEIKGDNGAYAYGTFNLN